MLLPDPGGHLPSFDSSAVARNGLSQHESWRWNWLMFVLGGAPARKVLVTVENCGCCSPYSLGSGGVASCSSGMFLADYSRGSVTVGLQRRCRL